MGTQNPVDKDYKKPLSPIIKYWLLEKTCSIECINIIQICGSNYQLLTIIDTIGLFLTQHTNIS